MRSARGFAYAKVVIALVVVAVVVGLVQYVRSWVEGYGAARFTAGELKERGVWQARESAELAAANTEILRLQKVVDDLEKRLIKEVAELESKHRREMKDAERQKQADVAAARAGTLSLRVPGRNCAPGKGPGLRAPAGEPAAAASGPDGAGTVELPRETTASLFVIANDADRIAKKVGRLQELVMVYYRVIERGCVGETKSPAGAGLSGDAVAAQKSEIELREESATPLERSAILDLEPPITVPEQAEPALGLSG